MEKIRRITALLTVIVIIGLIIGTIICAITGSGYFFGMLFLMIVVPVVLWMFMWFTKIVSGGETSEENNENDLVIDSDNKNINVVDDNKLEKNK